uniref:1-acyl-sn-glycerol-3-phosphate acyltransferase zeta n=1 Tax=Salmo salar TaxID=8030 RepID=B9ELV1_SALSA|nr:1-acyl-sn-glycerol-3-phosphate acyltransferase zeta precursor [Salmo salar]
MGPFLDFNPFDNLLCILLGISFTVWSTLLLVFIIVPAIFGVSFGIRRLYMKTLLKIFEWATHRIERGAKDNNHLLYKPYSNAIIAKEPTSLEEEINEIRRRGSNRDLDSASEFEMSDIFYFCQSGQSSYRQARRAGGLAMGWRFKARESKRYIQRGATKVIQQNASGNPRGPQSFLKSNVWSMRSSETHLWTTEWTVFCTLKDFF